MRFESCHGRVKKEVDHLVPVSIWRSDYFVLILFSVSIHVDDKQFTFGPFENGLTKPRFSGGNTSQLGLNQIVFARFGALKPANFNLKHFDIKFPL